MVSDVVTLGAGITVTFAVAVTLAQGALATPVSVNVTEPDVIVGV